jgi:hypothetical protein
MSLYSWEEMSKMYWEWFYSIPRTNNHPALATGECILTDQNDPNLFFLAGAYRADNKRRAKIHAIGKRIFMPVLVVSFTESELANTDLIEAARKDIDGTIFTEWDTSDDIIVEDVRRVTVPETFNVKVEKPPFFTNTTKAGEQMASSDGYWLLTKPLEKGFHTISTNGQTKEDNQFYGAVTYNLEVI